MAGFLEGNWNINTSGLTGAASGFVDYLMMIGVALVVLLIIWGVLYLLSFRHLVRVRQQTASGYVLIDTKAREFMKDGVKRWRFLKWIRESRVAPPSEYLEFTSKGRFSVECDKTTDGSITWRGRGGHPTGIDSFTGEERLVTANQMRRANEYNRQKTMDKIFQLAPMIMSIIIVVIIFAFWGDFVESTTVASKSTEAASAKLAEASDRLASAMYACHVVDPVNVSGVAPGGLPKIPD